MKTITNENYSTERDKYYYFMGYRSGFIEGRNEVLNSIKNFMEINFGSIKSIPTGGWCSNNEEKILNNELINVKKGG